MEALTRNSARSSINRPQERTGNAEGNRFRCLCAPRRRASKGLSRTAGSRASPLCPPWRSSSLKIVGHDVDQLLATRDVARADLSHIVITGPHIDGSSRRCYLLVASGRWPSRRKAIASNGAFKVIALTTVARSSWTGRSKRSSEATRLSSASENGDNTAIAHRRQKQKRRGCRENDAPARAGDGANVHRKTERRHCKDGQRAR